jgi:hypothetical protein
VRPFRAAWKDVQKVLTGLLAGSRRHRPADYLALNWLAWRAYPTRGAYSGADLLERSALVVVVSHRRSTSDGLATAWA